MRSLPCPTRRGLLLAAAGVALVVAGALSGFIDLVRAGVFALLLLALSMLLLLVAARASARVTHTGPRQPLEPGDVGEVRVRAELSTSARLAGGHLEEPHTFGGATPSWPLEGSNFDGSYRFVAPHRGRFHTGPTQLVVRDPFGLARISRDVSPRRNIIVWPRSDSAVSPDRSRSLVGDTSAESHLAFGGEAGTSVRQYVRGDDMRLVHWPATARRGELIVRQLDPPTDEAARARVLGHVERPGSDASWEGLLEACASWITQRHEARLPFALQIAEHTYRDHEGALDALAEASDCPEMADAQPPLVIFVHADTAGAPGLAPAGAHAHVAGSPAAVDRMRHQLEADGWVVSLVPGARPIERRTPASPAHDTDEGTR